MRLALFDLDHTLLSGDSDFEWAQFLIAKKVLDPEIYQAKNDHFYAQYKAGTLDIYEFLDFQLQALADHPRTQLDAWHREYMESSIRPFIGDKAKALVQGHRENGDLCIVATSTNSFVTGPICLEFGISNLIATIPAQENGRFTGKPRGIPAFREGKIARLEEWMESMGFWWDNFERIYFYSDSHNDLPLLSRVSHPVAVSPDETLLCHAQATGWPVLDLHPANKA